MEYVFEKNNLLYVGCNSKTFYLITISNHLIINNVLYEKLFKIF